MGMEKMSIHRGLAELKLLDAKIEKTTKTPFITVKNAIVDKIGGVSVTDIESEFKGSYQSLIDLIDRRERIKSAITKSNALTEVMVAGKTMTVSSVIEEKNAISYKKNALAEFKNQYTKAVLKVTMSNEKVNEQAETFINGLYSDKTQVDPNKIKELKQDYIEKNKLELVNPINLKQKIDALDAYIDSFETECNFILSESNAVTLIVI